MSSYSIVFKGEVSDPSKLDSIRTGLAKFLKVPEEKSHLLFSGKAITIKKDLEKEAAEVLQSKLRKSGVVTYIKPPRTAPIKQTVTPIQPKTSHKVASEASVSKQPDLSETWQERFDLVERKEQGEKLSWGESSTLNYNPWCLIFGPFYYMAKGMWVRGAWMLFLSTLVSAMLISAAVQGMKVPLQLPFGLAIFIMFFVNKDYYAFVKHGRVTWKWMPKWMANPFVIATPYIALMLFVVAVALGGEGDIREDVSGVWESDNSDDIIVIDLVSPLKYLSVNDQRIIVREAVPSETNSLLISLVLESNGKTTTWHVLKVESAEGGFTINVIFHDGSQDSYSYINDLP